MPKDAPPATDPADHRTGDAIRRRPVLAATGTLVGTVFGAGCLGDDSGAADSGGSNDPGGDSAETTDEETETTKEQETETATETEEPTATETADLPADMQEFQKQQERLVQMSHVADRKYDMVADERNRWTYRHVGETAQGGQEYERIVDIWVDDSVDPLGNYSGEELLTEDGIGDTFMGLLAFSPSGQPHFHAEARDPTEPQVVRHTYRVQQGPDYDAPFAAATVSPTAFPTIEERIEQNVSEEEYRNKGDKQILIEATANYLLEEDRLDIQA
jgi:hypothetical protein